MTRIGKGEVAIFLPEAIPNNYFDLKRESRLVVLVGLLGLAANPGF